MGQFSSCHFAMLQVYILIAIIYWGYEGYRYPHFLDWSVQDEKVKNLLSPAVNRSDLRGLNYNESIFDRSSAPDPARRAHNALPDPRVGEEGILSPHSPSLLPRDPMVPHSPSKLVPPLFRNKNLAIANRSRVSCINNNNNTMTLKSSLEVTQCHWKWCHSKA